MFARFESRENSLSIQYPYMSFIYFTLTNLPSNSISLPLDNRGAGIQDHVLLQGKVGNCLIVQIRFEKTCSGGDLSSV